MNFIPGTELSDTPATDPSADLGDVLADTGEGEFVVGPTKKASSTGTIGVVGLLAVLAGGVWFVSMRGGPQTASAAEEDSAAEISTFISEGQRHVTLMKQVLQNTPQVVQRFRESSRNAQVPLGDLARNPFQRIVEQPAVAVETDAGSRRRKDEERAAALQSARTLTLQTVSYGTSRLALINGQMLREGQTISDFTVDEIRPQSVVVRSGSYRFEVPIQK